MSIPRIIFSDVDGVWTDGRAYYSELKEELKVFSYRDGLGVLLCKHLGIEIVILTGEKSLYTTRRFEKLGITQLNTGVKNKLKLAKEICANRGVALEDVAFIGDDINDILLLEQVGYSCSPKNALGLVLRVVDFVSSKNGGDGVFTDVVLTILEKENLLDASIKEVIKTHYQS